MSVRVGVGQAESGGTAPVGRSGCGSSNIVGPACEQRASLASGWLKLGQLQRLVEKLEGLC